MKKKASTARMSMEGAPTEANPKENKMVLEDMKATPAGPLTEVNSWESNKLVALARIGPLFNKQREAWRLWKEFLLEKEKVALNACCIKILKMNPDSGQRNPVDVKVLSEMLNKNKFLPPGLPEEDVVEFCQSISLLDVPRNTVLMLQNETCGSSKASYYMQLDGECEFFAIFDEERAQELPVVCSATRRAGMSPHAIRSMLGHSLFVRKTGTFGEMGLITGEARSASVMTTEASGAHLLVCTRPLYRHLIMKHQHDKLALVGKLRLLRTVGALRAWAPAALSRLAYDLRPAAFCQGDILIAEGQKIQPRRPRHVYLITQGEVDVSQRVSTFLRGNKREIPNQEQWLKPFLSDTVELGALLDRSVAGEADVAYRRPWHLYTYRAAGPVEAYAISEEHYRRHLLMTNPDTQAQIQERINVLVDAFRATMGDHLRDLERRSADHHHPPASYAVNKFAELKRLGGEGEPPAADTALPIAVKEALSGHSLRAPHHRLQTPTSGARRRRSGQGAPSSSRPSLRLSKSGLATPAAAQQQHASDNDDLVQHVPISVARSRAGSSFPTDMTRSRAGSSFLTDVARSRAGSSFPTDVARSRAGSSFFTDETPNPPRRQSCRSSTYLEQELTASTKQTPTAQSPRSKKLLNQGLVSTTSKLNLNSQKSCQRGFIAVQVQRRVRGSMPDMSHLITGGARTPAPRPSMPQSPSKTFNIIAPPPLKSLATPEGMVHFYTQPQVAAQSASNHEEQIRQGSLSLHLLRNADKNHQGGANDGCRQSPVGLTSGSSTADGPSPSTTRGHKKHEEVQAGDGGASRPSPVAPLPGGRARGGKSPNVINRVIFFGGDM